MGRVLLMMACGGGFPVSKLVRLQPADIHSERMLTHIGGNTPGFARNTF